MQLTDQQVQAILAAVITAFGMWITYLQTRQNSAERRQDATAKVVASHDVALNGPTAARDARISALEAAGGRSFAVPPAWNQLNDPLPDGSLPAARYQECGEEVAAMVIMWKHGVPVSADALRAMLRRPGPGALTTAADVSELLRQCNVNAQAKAMSSADAKAAIRQETATGRPVPVLVTVPAGGYHWLCCYSSDDQHVHYDDPWGGQRVAQPWGMLMGRYAGNLVIVADQADDPLPA